MGCRLSASERHAARPHSLGKTEGKTMMDLYMAVTLAACFGVCFLFALWCGRVIRDEGEEQS